MKGRFSLIWFFSMVMVMVRPQDLFQVEPETDGAQDLYQGEPETDGAQDLFQGEPETDGAQDLFQGEPEIEREGEIPREEPSNLTKPEKILSQRYIPQVFEPYDDKFIDELTKIHEKIENSFEIDYENLEINKIRPTFADIKTSIREELDKLIRLSRKFQQQIQKISSSEDENSVSFYLQELNDRVAVEVESLIRHVDVFNERVKTLTILSDEKFNRLRANQLRETFEMYFFTFQDEAKEFFDNLKRVMNRLNELKAQSSEDFYTLDDEKVDEELLDILTIDSNVNTDTGLEGYYVENIEQEL